ncbi:putative RecA [Bacillus phage BSP36]|nr:putative RecA [Bacillus phage BSP36]
MAKKKQQNKKSVELNLQELGEDVGLTLLRDSDYAMVFDRLPLFLPKIDKQFGGGLPFGRMVEVAGKNAGGKSTLAFHAARVATKLGCIVVLIDVEGTADRVRLAHLGVDINSVFVKQPDESKGIRLTVEEIGRTIESTLEVFKSKYPEVPVIYIWDSLGQTPSETELDKDYGEHNVGARAKAITQLITKIAPQLSETKSMLLAINQIRDDIGGNPKFATVKVPGGKSWEHFASLRIEIKKKNAITKGDTKIGHIMGVKVNKSKVSRPHTEENAYLISDNGIDYEYNIAKMAEDAKVLGGTTQSYEYIDSNGERHKKKKDDFIEWMRTPEGQHVREELLNKLVSIEFPEGYVALKNKTLDISGWIDTVHEVGLTPMSELPENAGSDTDDILAEVHNEINGE